MRAAAVLLAAALGTTGAQAPPAPNPASPAPFDIYLLPLSNGLASMKTAKPQPLSIAPGYDNQPNFSPDGSRVLFAANRDGKQTDIFMFDRGSGRVTQVTHTAENENSPTFVPSGAGPSGSFSVVQSEFDSKGERPTPAIQRLWRFSADGKSPQLILKDITPVGYHSWIDSGRLALFVLGAPGKPATLQLASVKTGQAEVIVGDIGRSLLRIPGTQLVSFVHRDGAAYIVKQLDPATKRIDVLMKAVDGSSDRDMAWMPDGKTMLMSSGTRIFSWTRGATAWTEVFDAAAFQLGAVTRLAVSPTGDAIAIVVAEPSTRK